MTALPELSERPHRTAPVPASDRGGFAAAKDPSIESLRAIAIALVVGFHMRHDAPVVAGAGDFYEWLAYTFRHIRIPLFTVISGYLYAARPIAGGGALGGFVGGKVRRLLIPMWCVATVEYLLREVVYDAALVQDVSAWWQVGVMPYAHYWFLQAIFLVFVVVAVLETSHLLGTFRSWLLVTLSAYLAVLAIPTASGPMVFSLNGFLFLLPFFLLGVGIQRFGERMLNPLTVWTTAAVFVVGMAVYQLNWAMGDVLVDSAKARPVGLLIGVSAILLLFRARPSHPLLAWIGGFAFSIYLFQAFGASVGRRLLGPTGLEGHAYFLPLLAFTLAAGIALELAARRTALTRLLLLGQRPRGRATAAPRQDRDTTSSTRRRHRA